MGQPRVVRAVLVVVTTAGLWLAGGMPAALADTPTRSVESTGTSKKPKVTAKQVKAIATALGLPKSVIKRGLKGLEAGDGEQQQSGPNALPADKALDIERFTSFAGATGETLFVFKLGAAPESADVSYEYGVGVAIEGQPQSTPNPNAIEGFGRVALSRSFIRDSSGAILGLNPAASFARVETTATANLVDTFVIFRIPDSELGAGSYHLQAFGRQGGTAESPAGFSIVSGTLDS